MQKVLIVDDHEVLRYGLRIIIADFYPDAEITDVKDEVTALAELKKTKFDFVLLDVQMPASNCFEILNYVITRHIDTKVLIYSMGSETLFGKSFIKAGAHGYLSKHAPLKELELAFQTVMAGKKYMSTDLVNALVNDAANDAPGNPFLKLSPRETEITHFLLQGLSVSEICARVNLQSSTVVTHKSRIYEKLGVTNTMQIKDLAVFHHLVI